MLDSIPKRLAPLEEKRIVSVGRLSQEKGYMDLLRIFKQLSKKHKNWHLDIIGDGPERDKLEEYIKTRKLEEEINMMQLSWILQVMEEELTKKYGILKKI